MSHLYRTLILLLLAGVTITLCNVFPNAALNPESGVILSLPEVVRGYSSRSEEMSELENYWLPDDTLSVKRSYISDLASNEIEHLEQGFMVNVILGGADARSLHRPEVCMTGQGWTIDGRVVVELETEGGPLEVMDLQLSRTVKSQNGDDLVVRANYIYWWVGKEVSTPHSYMRILLSAFNNIFKNTNDRWAYPSVMVRTISEDKEKQTASRNRALDYIRQYAPTFQKSLGAKDIK